MTHRRAFLRQLATVAGAPALARLTAIDRAVERESRHVSATGGGASTAALRERYLLSPEITYFNHASIGTIPRAVHQARAAYLDLCETNPWLYMWGDAWEEPRERVRQKAAALLGCSPIELALTHNTTEGFNVLANGLDLGPGDEVVFSSLNHPGASVCWNHYARLRGFSVKRFEFPVLEVPRLSAAEVLDLYDRHIGPRTRVLVFSHIDNLVGLRYPVRELAALAHSRGVEFVAVDGAQAVGMVEVNIKELGVDIYCASPHKWLQAPKGLGLMYVRQELLGAIRPTWVTWGQERWAGSARIFEDYGTRNLPEVLALGDALDFQQGLGAAAKERRYRALWERFRQAAAEADHLTWRSPQSWGLSASLYALEIRGRASQSVFEHMWGQHRYVFRAFDTQDLNTVRISPNIYNDESEIDRFVELAAQVPRS